ncbi:D-hexose-6-phosphate mutarotase [Gilvimarinus agarilyticus]|uniref:D-hexose-6-phosphate mutarotase n=1 Tax=unclassified Gilvimarinus TaxID=2642066 RepID=UPI001C0984C5|nr:MULTISPECIES: D-hexose-6-phosphate mutarotase [unclassified Gilvimarinus]MBU2885170.1 D-hexose-6-phosphate mutarotase [Gilvimarinus agarilyticus]MDO6570069.1 D-hexose-6-phosphate mutarotase [Gilvimarinus sp. 2_MG-2023]MDO6745620.1 D-hexose-6-phosphate mutarotase [Gilvimarinus sp. 1_MG-2023]
MSQSSVPLQHLVDKHAFLTLTDSRTLFPDHPGEGLPLLQVNSEHCRAVIALNGGQLMSFCPTGGKELLWVSPNCQFKPGASLRGGIPLCLPWFGPHPTDSTKPNHGIARTAPWQLSSASQNEDGVCTLVLRFEHQADERFAHNFSAQLTIILGTTAQLTLALSNHSADSFGASWVMHSYFAIEDITSARVLGLEGREYADKVAGGKYFTQSGPVTFAGEVDRVYEDIQLPVTIEGHRRIHIEGDNCPSVVVWNTGSALGGQIADIGPGNHSGYVCVERGACLGDSWRLAPGETRQASMVLIPE